MTYRHTVLCKDADKRLLTRLQTNLGHTRAQSLGSVINLNDGKTRRSESEKRKGKEKERGKKTEDY